MFAQQPQKNSDQPVKNEEDNCCCTTYDANICLSKVQDKVDQELNQTYQSALKRWNEDPNREELRQAQRAWVSYRDAAAVKLVTRMMTPPSSALLPKMGGSGYFRSR